MTETNVEMCWQPQRCHRWLLWASGLVRLNAILAISPQFELLDDILMDLLHTLHTLHSHQSILWSPLYSLAEDWQNWYRDHWVIWGRAKTKVRNHWQTPEQNYAGSCLAKWYYFKGASKVYLCSVMQRSNNAVYLKVMRLNLQFSHWLVQNIFIPVVHSESSCWGWLSLLNQIWALVPCQVQAHSFCDPNMLLCLVAYLT